MPKILIEGAPPYDGEYELDLNFTNRDLHTVKQISGVRAGELDEAIRVGDLDVVVALAVNALRRAGHQVNIDILWDAEAGKITLIEDEADAVPPPPAIVPSDKKVSGEPDSSGVSGSSAGA